MRAKTFTIAPIRDDDKPKVSAFVRASLWSYIHIDYRAEGAFAWPGYLSRAESGRLTGVLGCGLDRPPVAHILYAAVDAWEYPLELMEGLLRPNEADLHAAGAQELAFVGYVPWLARVLRRLGFEERTVIVSYVWRGELAPAAEKPDVALRPATPDDVPVLTALDASAFEPMWRYPAPIHAELLTRLSYFSLAEMDGQAVGYCAGDVNYGQGQVIRLVVHPRWQGRGIGRYMLVQAMRHFFEQGLSVVTLNTQADNWPARHLYESLGFRHIGVDVPALVKRL